MPRLIRSCALFLAASFLVASAGCGDDDDGPRCEEVCGDKKPFCGPNGKCVECVYNSDCSPNAVCGENFECHD